MMRKICLGESRRGFTLVELMVVVAIIAILAGFLAPSVSTYMRRAEGRSAARNVSNMLRMAHNQAMTRGEVILAEITIDGGNNAEGDPIEGGRIELFRTDNSTATECDAADPADTDCFALSCAQAQSMQRQSVEVFDIQQNSPDMVIMQMDPDVDSRLICFSPNGRVLDTTGLPIESTDSECDATNLRIFVRSDEPGADMTNPLGGPDLDKCIESVDSVGDVDATKQGKRQEQKDGRDLVNFFSIHVPFNGATTVTQ